MPRRRALVPVRLLTPLLALLAFGALAAVSAQEPPDGPAPDQAGPDWIAWVDTAYGFGLLLPPGHRLARPSGVGQWYAHGTLDGEPLVPDVSIAFLPKVTAAQALEDFPDHAEAEEVSLGPGTRGLRVTATYQAEDGTPYQTSTYLAEGPEGTFRIARYEGFDWPPFDAVARSVHLVRKANDPLP
jgi:hypothetical protein